MVKLNQNVPHHLFSEYHFFDDFAGYTDGYIWTAQLGTSATAALDTATPGGHMTMTTGTGVANSEAFLSTVGFRVSGGSTIPFELVMRATGPQFTDGSAVFGMATTVSSTLIADGAAGDLDGTEHVAFFRKDGESVWRCSSLIDGVRKDTLTNKTSTASRATYRITGEGQGNGTTLIKYWIDDNASYNWVALEDETGKQISHLVEDFLTVGQIVFGGKNNGAGDEPGPINVDYVSLIAERSGFSVAQ